MKQSTRRIRQEKLAKLFYEMGMDLNLVSKISGIDVNKTNKFESSENKLRSIDKEIKDNIWYSCKI